MNRILKFAATSILMLLLAGVANASEDGKSYSPAFCTLMFHGAAYSNPSYAVTPWQFLNLSGYTTNVVCPIVKDNEYSTTGLSFVSILINNPSGSTTTCTIYSLDAAGNTVAQPVSASTSMVGSQTLYLYPYPSQSSYWGTYSIMCSLPHSASIRSYTIFEN
jgi:hypothetical protein